MANLSDLIQGVLISFYERVLSVLSPNVYLNVLEKAIMSVIILAIGYIIAKRVSNIAAKRSEGTLEEHKKSILTKLTYYGILIFTIVILIRSVFGTTLSGFFAAAGLTGIVLGLAAQKSMSNLISGIFLFVDRSFEIGDMVEVGEYIGYVREISLLSTRIVTFDNTLVRIPNERMFTEDVRNDSKFGIRRLDLDIGISYGSSIDKAREIILDVLKNDEKVIDGPEPTVVVKELDDSAVTLQARPWIDPEDWKIKFRLIEEIKKKLTKGGVEIPFPQRTVYLRKEDGDKGPEDIEKKNLDLVGNNFNVNEDEKNDDQVD